MPNRKVVDKLVDKIDAMTREITILQVEAVWIKRIIIGAASLGFIEKAVSMFVK